MCSRRWFVPVACSGVYVAAGVAYLLGWGPLVLHRSAWTIGGDVWGIFRAAHYVGWGDFSGLYSVADGLPGLSVLLAPVAVLSGALGLSESSPVVFVAHPGAALLLVPVELLLGCVLLFAVDSLAVLLGLRSSLRLVLVGSVAVVAWPVVAVWGHVEDLLSLALALVALRFLVAGRFRSAGWFIAAGVLVQPLVGLLLPVLLVVTPARRRLGFVVRAVVPSALLSGLAFLGDPSGVVRGLAQQTTQIAPNHATPWLVFAPVVGPGPGSSSVVPRVVFLHGHFVHVAARVFSVVQVSGGLVRTAALVFAVVLGAFFWRRRPDVVGLVWVCAVALSLRCFFEPVMTPYYLAPPVVVALLAAASASRWRFGFAVLGSFAVAVFAYGRFSPWVWWLPVVGMLAVVLACGYPGRSRLWVSAGGVGVCAVDG